MAFTSTLIKKGFTGNMRWELHSFSNGDGDVGGNVTFTWLKRVLIASLQDKSAGAMAAGSVINATFPLATNVVPIVSQAGTGSGYIMAWGDPV